MTGDRTNGEIFLSFVNRNGRTISDRTYRHGNSRISANIRVTEDPFPCYFLISTGGGLTEGERYRQDIVLTENTHAILTTQAPTYIYKCENGQTTSLVSRICVGKDAFLEYYPDELIPYAKALFDQRTDIDLAEGARLILTDGLTGGWSADDRPFQYGLIRRHMRIASDGELLCNDFLRVDPREEAMGELGFFEGMTSFHSVVIMDAAADKEMVSLLRQTLEEKCPQQEKTLRYGLSLLEKGGFVFRSLSATADESAAAMKILIDAYREKICGLAPLSLRKTVHETNAR